MIQVGSARRSCGSTARRFHGCTSVAESTDKQIIGILAGRKGVPAFKVQEIGQANTVTKPDFSVPVPGGLYGY